MKTKKHTLKQWLILSLIFFLTTGGLWAQIQLEGLYSEGEGGAGWNADGSGPEALGNGHDNVFYYAATRDYVDPAYTSGAHLTNIGSDFLIFEQILLDYGFSLDQMTMKTDLSNMGEDVEGMDHFTIAGIHYANYYPLKATFELDGDPMIEVIGDYSHYITGTGLRLFKTGYLKVNNIAFNSSNAVNNVTKAFMQALGDTEIVLNMEVSPAAGFAGNGRSGAYYDMNITLEKGSQKWPFKGLYQDHEGFAGWDANGTGLEPSGNGHGSQLYYGASLDYEGIDPDPNACLGHFLEGSAGFLNTLLQLEYNGLDVSALSLKLGLNSLGPDKRGEDWNNGYSNYYNNVFTFELNGEPILEILGDTNKLMHTSIWMSESSFGKVYNISENASMQAQNVAASLMKDIGGHSLQFITNRVTISANFNGEGRDGAYYNIEEAYIKGVREEVTYVNEGEVNGRWTLEGSPYYIEGPLLIENNLSLRVESGVKIAIRGAYPITVEGNIIAEGTEELPIQFSSSNPNIYWDGFDYEGDNIISEELSKFDHCLFQYGSAGGGSAFNSGGIFAVRNYNDIEIYNSTFQNNIAEISASIPTCGGAIALWEADMMVQNCIFKDNYALDYGGAIMAYEYSDPIISNCLFYDNESSKGGALTFYEHSNGIVINNTIVNNMAEVGGAIYFHRQSSPEIINNILWENEVTMEGSQVFFSGSPSYPEFYNNDIEEGLEGFGGIVPDLNYRFNIDEDPMFEDREDFSYIQNSESPCINQGSPNGSLWHYTDLIPEECLCGAERHLNGCIDMGCYEVEKSVGVKDQYQKDEINISPNPVTSTALIQYDLASNGWVKIEIFNLMGQQVEVVFNAYQTAGEQSFYLNVESYQKGPYLIKISTSDQSYLSKFIKN